MQFSREMGHLSDHNTPSQLLWHLTYMMQTICMPTAMCCCVRSAQNLSPARTHTQLPPTAMLPCWDLCSGLVSPSSTLRQACTISASCKVQHNLLWESAITLGRSVLVRGCGSLLLACNRSWLDHDCMSRTQVLCGLQCKQTFNLFFL